MQSRNMRLSEKVNTAKNLSVFSTVGAPIEERIPLWEHETRATMLGLRVSSFARDSISSTMLNSSLQSVKLTAIKGNEHVVERSDELLETSRSDSIAFCLLNQGDAFYYSREGVHNLRALDAIIYDADTPFMYGFKSSMAQYVFQISRAEFYRLTGLKRLEEPLIFRNDNTNLLDTSRRIFASTIRMFQQGKDIQSQRIEKAFQQVFQQLIGTDHGNPEDAYFVAAKQYVHDHWTNPDLSVNDVAKAAGISQRQLARIFAAKDLSVGKFIRDVRLEHTYELLRSGQHQNMNIGQIAEQAGFLHASQFSRAFKAKYGMTPREARDMNTSTH